MNSDSKNTAVIDTLVELLSRSPFELHEIPPGEFPVSAAASAKGSVPTPQTLCLSRSPRLIFTRVGVELVPELGIQDSQLGSLGLVRVMTAGGKDTAKAKLEQWIDEATHVRHLLLTDPSTETTAPYPVELVAVFPAGAQVSQGLGECLRALAQRMPYLHAISVNLLGYSTDSAMFVPEEVERAFAWLLPRTRRLLAEQAAQGNGNPPQRLAEVRMTNYRLNGVRTLKLKNDERVHVIHGHNGSGKSSLVEAIELGVTGRVARIDATRIADPSVNYFQVIANRPSARVKVAFSHRTGVPDQPHSLHEVELTDAGALKPLAGALDARSFRLNQAFMDSLTAGNDVDRADAFLRAFFPDAREATIKLEEAREAWLASVAALPGSLMEAPPSFEAELLQALTRGSENTFFVELLCPLDRLTVQRFARLSPRVGSAWEAVQQLLADPGLSATVDDSRLDTSLASLDEAISLAQRELAEHLPLLLDAERLVRLLERWVADPDGPPAGDLPSTLGRWLKLTALEDLGERLLHLLDTRAALEALGAATSLGDEELGMWAELGGARDRRRLREQVQRWRTLREASAADVQSLTASPSVHADGTGTGGTAHAPRLVSQELATLDQVGRWLFAADGFGAAIGRALLRNGTEPFSRVTIGGPGWTTAWGAQLSELLAATKKIQALDLSTQGGVARLSRYRSAAACATAKLLAEEDVEKRFLSHLRDLEGPMNELLALFTPARWAYSPTALRHSPSGDGRQRLQLLTDGDSRADLRFNTAELNTLTIALFLLCAARVGNPLHLLAFDDPFQNMDELTIRTVLRGLARIAQLLPRDWQIIILVHGEETLDVVRRELACATYALPWLNPSSATEDESIDIEADPLNLRASSLQSLGELMQRPR